MDFVNNLQFDYADVEEAFPACDPGVRPFGSRVLVQVRTAKKKTKGGLFIPEDVRDTEQYNTQVGKVIAIGPVAFRNRQTLEPWPEGDWAKPGDFVRLPKYGGDRWDRRVGDTEDFALFVIFNDLDLTGEVSDPLALKAFI